MKIEEARKQKNMSRKELSEWLEIPYRTLTNWENGERSCPDYIEKLIVEKILRDKYGCINYIEPQTIMIIACGFFYKRRKRRWKERSNI